MDHNTTAVPSASSNRKRARTEGEGLCGPCVVGEMFPSLLTDCITLIEFFHLLMLTSVGKRLVYPSTFCYKVYYAQELCSRASLNDTQKGHLFYTLLPLYCSTRSDLRRLEVEEGVLVKEDGVYKVGEDGEHELIVKRVPDLVSYKAKWNKEGR